MTTSRSEAKPRINRGSNPFNTVAMPGTERFAPYGQRTPAAFPGGYTGEPEESDPPMTAKQIDRRLRWAKARGVNVVGI